MGSAYERCVQKEEKEDSDEEEDKEDEDESNPEVEDDEEDVEDANPVVENNKVEWNAEVEHKEHHVERDEKHKPLQVVPGGNDILFFLTFVEPTEEQKKTNTPNGETLGNDIVCF